MERIARRIAGPVSLIAITLSFIPASSAFAADGIPLCNVPGNQDSPSVATATDLATWVAWRDFRRSIPDIYVAHLPGIIAIPGAGQQMAVRDSHLLSDGAPVCESGTAGPPIAVPTDSGGVLVLFGDNRVPRGIYAVRLLSDGSRYPGWPVDGRLLIADNVDPVSMAACTDGAGGAYIARKRIVSSELQTCVVTRVTKDGAFSPGWTDIGVAIGGDEQVQGWTLEADPSGGAVFTVRQYFNGMVADLQYGRAGRISPSGVIGPNVSLPGWRSGNFAPGNVASFAIADGTGGLFAVWNDAPAPVFYGQHWSGAGAVQWPDSLPAPHMDALVRDLEGGVYVVGREKQDLNHLAVLRRDAGGSVHAGWNPAGFVVADPLALAHVRAIAWASLFGNNGGVLVVWSDNRGTGTGFDLRALHVRKDARLDPNWPGGGLPICDAPGNQTSHVVSDRGVVVWVDERNTATSGKDLWTIQLSEPPWPVGVPQAPGNGSTALAIRSVFPNPASDGVNVAFAHVGDEPLRVSLIDLRGRIVRSHAVTPGGDDQARVMLPTRGLPAGLYWVRAVQGKAVAHARVILLE